MVWGLTLATRQLYKGETGELNIPRCGVQGAGCSFADEVEGLEVRGQRAQVYQRPPTLLAAHSPPLLLSPHALYPRRSKTPEEHRDESRGKQYEASLPAGRPYVAGHALAHRPRTWLRKRQPGASGVEEGKHGDSRLVDQGDDRGEPGGLPRPRPVESSRVG